MRPSKVVLSDYVGEYSFLGTTLRQANIEPMPSLTDVRRLVTEYTILPLGGALLQPTLVIVHVVLIHRFVSQKRDPDIIDCNF